MKIKITQPLWQVAALGVLAGMRTTSAPAIAGYILRYHYSKGLSNSSVGLLRSEELATALKILVIVEFIADKLPSTPKRIKPFSLVARCLSGGLAGTSICKASGDNALTGAILGAGFAFAATFGSYYLRKSIVRGARIFDPIVGAIEDALVLGAGEGLIKTA